MPTADYCTLTIEANRAFQSIVIWHVAACEFGFNHFFSDVTESIKKRQASNLAI
jgi:hypothetical protein